MKFRKHLFVAVISISFVTLVPTAVKAVTIDFTGHEVTSSNTSLPSIESVISDDYKDFGIIFGKAYVSAGVAAVDYESSTRVFGLDASGISPGTSEGLGHLGDIYFHFVVPGTTNPGMTDFVSFNIGDAGGDLDNWQIRIFDTDGNTLDTRFISSIEFTTVSIDIPNIHRVEIDFLNQQYGYLADDFTFNTPVGTITTNEVPIDTQAVPLPAAGIVGMGLLAGLGVVRKIRSK